LAVNCPFYPLTKGPVPARALRGAVFDVARLPFPCARRKQPCGRVLAASVFKFAGALLLRPDSQPHAKFYIHVYVYVYKTLSTTPGRDVSWKTEREKLALLDGEFSDAMGNGNAPSQGRCRCEAWTIAFAAKGC